MADSDSVRLQPDDIVNATEQLDDMARRLDQLMEVENPNLAVKSPGADEVSQRVAATLTRVHAMFGESVAHGSNEMREIAATLRSHTDNIRAVDDGFVV
jgi:hypothetical protein